MRSKVLLVALAIVLTGSLALAGCGKSGGGGGTAGTTKDQVVVGISSEPTSLDEHQITDYNSDRVASEIYNTLVRFKDEGMEVEPDLATAWKISDDGLTYTFTLRDGVKFQDGTDFNADAVVWNYKRMTDPKAEGYDTATGGYGYAETLFGEVKDCKASDAKTVVFTLKEPFAPFLSTMAMTQFSIVSPTAVMKYGKDYTSNPVGTGAFKFKSWTKGTEVVLEANPDYFRGAPKIKTLIYRFITDSNVRQNDFESGSLNVMVDIIPDNLKALKDNSAFNVVESESLHTWYLSLNCATKPFNDKRVRQAFMYGINRKEIVDGILQGTSTLAENFLPPVTPYYTTDVHKYPYDPDKAKQLLAEAGQSNLTVDFYVPESGSGMQQADAMATAIQSDMKKVGVTLNIKKLEWGAYLDKMFRAPEGQDMLMGEMSWISDNGDPDNFLRILAGGDQWPAAGFNSAYYKNPDFDAAVKQGMTSNDDAVRKEAYTKAQKIFMEDVPYTVVDHEKQIVAMDKNLKDVKINPRGFFRFQYASWTK